MTSDALFRLESISKVVCTAPVVLALSERGVLRLDEPVATGLPECRSRPNETITLRQLLSHSSGLPDTDEIVLDSVLGAAELWTRILAARPVSLPGTRVH